MIHPGTELPTRTDHYLVKLKNGEYFVSKFEIQLIEGRWSLHRQSRIAWWMEIPEELKKASITFQQ